MENRVRFIEEDEASVSTARSTKRPSTAPPRYTEERTKAPSFLRPDFTTKQKSSPIDLYNQVQKIKTLIFEPLFSTNKRGIGTKHQTGLTMGYGARFAPCAPKERTPQWNLVAGSRPITLYRQRRNGRPLCGRFERHCTIDKWSTNNIPNCALHILFIGFHSNFIFTPFGQVA